MMRLRYSEEFKKDLHKIKDRSLRLRVLKSLKKLAENPRGKHLKYSYKGFKRLRVDPFRILYKVDKDVIFVASFEHRKKAYSK